MKIVRSDRSTVNLLSGRLFASGLVVLLFGFFHLPQIMEYLFVFLAIVAVEVGVYHYFRKAFLVAVELNADSLVLFRREDGDTVFDLASLDQVRLGDQSLLVQTKAMKRPLAIDFQGFSRDDLKSLRDRLITHPKLAQGVYVENGWDWNWSRMR